MTDLPGGQSRWSAAVLVRQPLRPSSPALPPGRCTIRRRSPRWQGVPPTEFRADSADVARSIPTRHRSDPDRATDINTPASGPSGQAQEDSGRTDPTVATPGHSVIATASTGATQPPATTSQGSAGANYVAAAANPPTGVSTTPTPSPDDSNGTRTGLHGPGPGPGPGPAGTCAGAVVRPHQRPPRRSTRRQGHQELPNVCRTRDSRPVSDVACEG